MAHVLVFEAALGGDHVVFEALLRMGHTFSFVTADLADIERQRHLGTPQYLTQAHAVLEIWPFRYEAFEEAVLALHAEKPIDALLCFFDRRQVEAARLAKKLGLCYLNPETAALMYDKYDVRQFLEKRGIPQPEYRLATTTEELKQAIDDIGYPLLIKPADGYGSFDILIIRNAEDHDNVAEKIETILAEPIYYTLGVSNRQRMIVERYMTGSLLRCDTVTVNGKHSLIGINEMQMFEPPFCAVKGSVYPSTRFDHDEIERYLSRALDELGFDWGFANSELMVTNDGIFIVEMNPRLVGFHRLIALAYDRSVVEEVIELHLTRKLKPFTDPPFFTASRWLAADSDGLLVALKFPRNPQDMACFFQYGYLGDQVSRPWTNSDRIAGVITRETTMEAAEEAAESFIQNTKMIIYRGDLTQEAVDIIREGIQRQTAA